MAPGLVTFKIIGKRSFWASHKHIRDGNSLANSLFIRTRKAALASTVFMKNYHGV